jgi:hypothetical protein
MNDGPFVPLVRGKLRFIVEVLGTDENHRATRRAVGYAVKPEAAFKLVTGVIAQWGASYGAIAPGTKVVIRDTNDGGPLFVAEYLGYGTDLLGGMQ